MSKDSNVANDDMGMSAAKASAVMMSKLTFCKGISKTRVR